MQKLTIGPFVYDPADQCLWKGDERIELTPKTFAVLACLVAKAGRLVTKDELIRTVWPDVCVTDAVLKVRVAELRKRLCDPPGQRLFIETLHRRGYRLVAPVTLVAPRTVPSIDPSSTPSTAPSTVPPALSTEPASDVASEDGGCPVSARLEGRSDAPPLVGRERSLASLFRHLEKADAGDRRLVFVTGEAGAGKTALLRAFCRRLERRADTLVATGHCVEHHGAQEAFLPVLDALGKLCRSGGGAALPTLLRGYAPTWLAQMPWLQSDDDRVPLAEDLLGATRSRMSREFGLFCEIATRDRSLVLVLEDLHWCDHATVELLSWLVSQQGAARLLVVVSLRPAELDALDHPLETLRRHRLSRDPSARIPVEPLEVPDIGRYLRHRLPERSGHAATAAWLHGRTSGNPLFVVNLVNYLQEHGPWPGPPSLPHPSSDASAPAGAIVDDVVPDSLKRVIAAQTDRLEPRYRELLLAASVGGDVFCAGVLGAALDDDPESLDETCRHLAASDQFIRHVDLCELPDGTRADRYTFIHVLYRDSLSQSLSARRRARLHQLIGAHKARVYAGSTHLIAAELVTHFEQAGRPLLAIRFLRESASNALTRFANRAAVCHLTSALTLLDKVPDAERNGLEAELLERRGLVYRTMADMPAAVADFERMLELARASGHVHAEVDALTRLSSALSWNDRERCLATVDETRSRCRLVADDALRASTLGSCAYWNLLWRGWDERDAKDCLRAATFARTEGPLPRSGATLSRASYFLCLSGEYERAAGMAGEGMAIATENGDSFEYLLALYFRGWALLHAGRWDRFIETVDAQAFRVADSNDHQFWHLLFTLLRSWLEEACGDVEAAYRSASDALARAERHDLPFGRLLGLVRLGFACQGLGREREAHDAFARCETWLAGERVLMDWIVSMPMHLGLSRHHARAGDPVRARTAARSALRIAQGPGEPVYTAAALETLSSIADATGDRAEAEAVLTDAFHAMKGVDSPAVSLRLHATGARLADARGDTRRATRHRSIGARLVARLSGSLRERPDLRRAFERSPSAMAVRSRGSEADRAAPERESPPETLLRA